MKYLTGEEILVLHSEIIDETGGSHGVRDSGLLISVIKRPKATFGGKELYGDVFKKASVYLDSLANFHIFTDGNKRTAIAAAARFLFLNGYELIAANKEVEIFALKVVVEKLSLGKIAAWLKKHSRKI